MKETRKQKKKKRKKKIKYNWTPETILAQQRIQPAAQQETIPNRYPLLSFPSLTSGPTR
jgi:hypothetical protein